MKASRSRHVHRVSALAETEMRETGTRR
jgi:hypothetical protein